VSAQYFIAKVTQLDQYVVLMGNKVVAGPFATAQEAIRAREELIKSAATNAS
jgi:hypothetical protein